MMRPAFYLWLIMAAFTVLSACQKEPEPQPEAPLEIPDPNFLQALIDLGVDTDGDSLISFSEAEVIRELQLWDKNISDLTGIGAFIHLETLVCVSNQLTALDISGCSQLKALYCSENQLSSLDVSNNTKLEILWCADNLLTGLDVSANTALMEMGCMENGLTIVDLSENTLLEILHSESNMLTALDLTQNLSLKEIYLSGNQLTSLDVSQNTALNLLDCSENQLTGLDVSANTKLYDLYLKKMPSLYEVCVWKLPIPFYAYTFGSPNVLFTTECNP